MERSSHGGGLTMSDGESNKKAVASTTTTLKKGPWTAEEDQKLVDYIGRNGHGSWRALPKEAGLNRCGKSCRLRWTNYLRPDIKRGNFSQDEEKLIIHLHSLVGNKWSTIAGHLPGRTDNEIKNLWNTHLKKKLLQMGIDPITHRPISTDHLFANYNNTTNNNTSMTFPLDKIHVLNNLLFQLLNYNLLLSSSSNNESIVNNTTINHDYYSSLLEHYYSNCTTSSNNTHDNPQPLFIPPSTSNYINTNNVMTNNDNTIDNNIPSSEYTSCNINNDHQLPPMLLHNNAHTTPNNNNNNNNDNNNNNSSIISSFEASPLDDVDDSSYWNHIIMDLASSQTSMDNNIIH